MLAHLIVNKLMHKKRYRRYAPYLAKSKDCMFPYHRIRITNGIHYKWYLLDTSQLCKYLDGRNPYAPVRVIKSGFDRLGRVSVPKKPQSLDRKSSHIMITTDKIPLADQFRRRFCRDPPKCFDSSVLQTL